MNKDEVYAFLLKCGVNFEVTEHKAVYNMKEMAEIELPHPEADAKNLFIRDDKKRNYYLLTVKGDKKVDLKEFRKNQQTRALSFASDEDLSNILGLIPGAVTPLGILNDDECKVKVFIDEELIGIHPNDNTATVWLQTMDLVKIIREHGNDVRIINM
ncbi:MAG: prolyl-tRNA editing protein [Clostridiales bacterium]|nr:MAG: prolyl-tRNA editing protein [Clostridiales bacterium]